jgi:P pilus assembly chaperone PapD
MTLPEAVEKLQWQCHGNTLRAVNPTPLHISLTQLHINGQNVDADMVNPRMANARLRCRSKKLATSILTG